MAGADGSFQVNGLPVDPTLTLERFESSPARNAAEMSYGRDAVRTRVEGGVLGRAAIVGLEFSNAGLTRASIFLRLDGDGTSWDDWTLGREMRRKRAHEELAVELFGRELALKPMDINGKPILPLEPGPEYPRHAVFDWGEVVSGYDSKGGMAEMWIVYG